MFKISDETNYLILDANAVGVLSLVVIGLGIIVFVLGVVVGWLIK